MTFDARRTRVLALALACCATALLAVTAPASAADPQCRASALRLSALQSPLAEGVAAEPIRANDARTPCTPQSSTTVEETTVGPVRLAAADAATGVEAGPMVGAGARAADLAVTLPGLSVEVDAVQAAALATCTGGTTARSGSSRVAGLRVNATQVALPPGDAPFRLDLGPLGSISVNEAEDDGTALVRRALAIRTPVATVVVAEAIAGGDACAAARGAAGDGAAGAGSAAGGAGAGGPGTGAGSTDDGSTNATGASAASRAVEGVCPAGSTYVIARQVCVIAAGAAGNGQPVREIVIGKPFEGPRGGTVLPLSVARERFGGACTRGRGPAYAVVGTAGADKITGSGGADRVIALAGADRVASGGGDDCVDGGRDRDVLAGSLGDDRVYGGRGNDAVNGGPGNDGLTTGSGNDTVNTAYGRDRVSTGTGRDAINAATAGPTVRTLRCGGGRDTVRINRNERRKPRGCERVFVVR